jgi:carbonic anhydrase
MKSLPQLFEQNRAWARSMTERDPQIFQKLSQLQAPQYLWIGCSDSRVPANEIVGLAPGEMFVHRNVGNVVVHSDLNCLSVLQFAIDQLRVKHVIVCGHYGCGGVRAALESRRHGLVDHWLRHIRDVAHDCRGELDARRGEDQVNRLCELNVLAQVRNVAVTPVVQEAWASGHHVEVHGWIYGLSDGLLRDLGVTIASPEDIPENYRLG